MYHMGDQPTSFPEEFELSEDSEEIEMEYFGRVLRVQEERVEGESVQEENFQFFWIGDEEEEMEQDPEQDPLYQWYDVQDQEQYVRMIHVEKTKERYRPIFLKPSYVPGTTANRTNVRSLRGTSSRQCNGQ